MSKFPRLSCRPRIIFHAPHSPSSSGGNKIYGTQCPPRDHDTYETKINNNGAGLLPPFASFDESISGDGVRPPARRMMNSSIRGWIMMTHARSSALELLSRDEASGIQVIEFGGREGHQNTSGDLGRRRRGSENVILWVDYEPWPSATSVYFPIVWTGRPRAPDTTFLPEVQHLGASKVFKTPSNVFGDNFIDPPRRPERISTTYENGIRARASSGGSRTKHLGEVFHWFSWLVDASATGQSTSLRTIMVTGWTDLLSSREGILWVLRASLQ
ncbi:hypothetical protein GGX14DRAFT_403298 [Mycena pura]|uniref:Uncharacterized protein n=1 Tax=Mycena pura TaxID=153505 RepID=A0AAD6UW53_9AGAR|nr:hypothetical protein GGX14DRAFT_403298 [Mycena pura]